MLKKLKLTSSLKTYLISKTNTKKKKTFLFITGDWNAKIGRQEIPGVTGKYRLGVQNEAGQKLRVCQESTFVIASPSSNNTRTLHMDITKW